ncbi:hypothetical protein EVAR_74788_1 [Eumeta japonica]|uniref:Uncharacterized protein n=1 Tax=Eumeta variegata TaxID=151549 RepID=A0A4C1SS42_EUMVA|nr:hypothetical protein EVAR_74788_1 [Eumeta japonica]
MKIEDVIPTSATISPIVASARGLIIPQNYDSHVERIDIAEMSINVIAQVVVVLESARTVPSFSNFDQPSSDPDKRAQLNAIEYISTACTCTWVHYIPPLISSQTLLASDGNCSRDLILEFSFSYTDGRPILTTDISPISAITNEPTLTEPNLTL